MEPTRAQRGALAGAALGVLLITAGGMDAPWQLFINTDPSVPADAAFSGTWLVVRLMLIGMGGALLVAAAGTLWATRDEGVP